MRIGWAVTMAFGAVVALAACGGDDDGEPAAARTACESAFAAAAAIGDTEDTVEDLDSAVESCTTVEEWSAASDQYPDALDGVDPLTFLANRCQPGGGLAQSDLCTAVAPERAPDQASFAQEACAGSSYTGCESGLQLAMDVVPGTLVAICEYEDDQGDVVFLDDASEAESRCSADGLNVPSRVFDVVMLP